MLEAENRRLHDDLLDIINFLAKTAPQLLGGKNEANLA